MTHKKKSQKKKTGGSGLANRLPSTSSAASSSRPPASGASPTLSEGTVPSSAPSSPAPTPQPAATHVASALSRSSPAPVSSPSTSDEYVLVSPPVDIRKYPHLNQAASKTAPRAPGAARTASPAKAAAAPVACTAAQFMTSYSPSTVAAEVDAATNRIWAYTAPRIPKTRPAPSSPAVKPTEDKVGSSSTSSQPQCVASQMYSGASAAVQAAEVEAIQTRLYAYTAPRLPRQKTNTDSSKVVQNSTPETPRQKGTVSQTPAATLVTCLANKFYSNVPEAVKNAEVEAAWPYIAKYTAANEKARQASAPRHNATPTQTKAEVATGAVSQAPPKSKEVTAKAVVSQAPRKALSTCYVKDFYSNTPAPVRDAEVEAMLHYIWKYTAFTAREAERSATAATKSEPVKVNVPSPTTRDVKPAAAAATTTAVESSKAKAISNPTKSTPSTTALSNSAPKIERPQYGAIGPGVAMRAVKQLKAEQDVPTVEELLAKVKALEAANARLALELESAKSIRAREAGISALQGKMIVELERQVSELKAAQSTAPLNRKSTREALGGPATAGLAAALLP
ncbi:hypothetical protein HK405_011601, partial [Cladochytrium tenue]